MLSHTRVVVRPPPLWQQQWTGGRPRVGCVSSYLDGERRDEEVVADGGEAVSVSAQWVRRWFVGCWVGGGWCLPLEEGHEEAETDEDHNVDILELTASEQAMVSHRRKGDTVQPHP